MSSIPSERVIALVDCNNFYVSCERVFAPWLAGKPVAVLSNNDGCVIARSEELKAQGVAMGTPVQALPQQLHSQPVQLLSSNYAPGNCRRWVSRRRCSCATATPRGCAPVSLWSCSGWYMSCAAAPVCHWRTWPHPGGNSGSRAPSGGPSPDWRNCSRPSPCIDRPEYTGQNGVFFQGSSAGIPDHCPPRRLQVEVAGALRARAAIRQPQDGAAISPLQRSRQQQAHGGRLEQG